MDSLRSFRELILWQKSHQLFLDFVKDVELFHRNQARKIVTDQILRSSASISANVAEGFGRRKGKEYVHYLIIGRGSTTETLNWLIKCLDMGWVSKDLLLMREGVVEEILKMLNKMIGQKINY
jgi:four helix bundle protein